MKICLVGKYGWIKFYKYCDVKCDYFCRIECIYDFFFEIVGFFNYDYNINIFRRVYF